MEVRAVLRQFDLYNSYLYTDSAMQKAIPLSVSARDAKENVKSLRKVGEVPGVVYGNQTKNTPIKCNAKALHGVYVKAGENTLVDVDLGGKKVACLIHAISFDPVTSAYEHVDFYAVDMTKKVTTHVPVIFEGESPAVKTLGGVLLTVHSQLEVTCLPTDIPSHFTVNLNSLENLRDSITVGKLKVPAGVTVKESPETAIIIVQEPRKEEVIEVVAAVVAEGAVPAEGAAAEGAAAAPGAPGAAPAAATGKPGAPAKDDKAGGGKDKAAKK